MREKIYIKNPRNVLQFASKIVNKKQENFGLILLNADNSVIENKIIFIGGLDSTIVDNKIIFWRACTKLAKAMIVYHNHPSGSVSPSEADNDFTKRLYNACDIMGIQLLDSIIVTKNGYYSYKEETRIFDNPPILQKIADR